MSRKWEYFGPNKIEKKESISHVPPLLFPQERDWTCAFACIRSMLSGVMKTVPAEEDIVSKYQLVPGPHYSKDIKKLGLLEEVLKDGDIIYGCDREDIQFGDILGLLDGGYYVMLESMVNYSHWMVLLGYFTIADYSNPEKFKLLFYDPYYNEVRLLNYDEFLGMWIDGNFASSDVKKDFIAIHG